jgi:hypothetical protein
MKKWIARGKSTVSKKTVTRFFPMRKMIGQRRTRTRGNIIYGSD